MLFIVFTTGRCNLRCSYCGGSIPPHLVPWQVEYELSDLVRFLSGVNGELVVAFYGGEPLLNAKFVARAMECVEADRFVMQTNGTVIDVLDPPYWRKFDAVLLSIDGRREVTDLYRGRGAYDAAVRAAKRLRERGFSGDLVARMTATEATDIYTDVTHLLSLGLFDHVHWQLNVVWSEPWRDLNRWARLSYLPGLTSLCELWLARAREGEVLGIAPILGMLRGALTGGLAAPPCGAGKDAFAVLPSGKVLACPVAFDAEWAYLGDIWSSTPPDLVGKVGVGEPCTTCDAFELCGGRCLYAHFERYWGREGFRAVCELTKHLVREVRRMAPEVKRLIASGALNRGDVFYPPFNNTVEVVP